MSEGPSKKQLIRNEQIIRDRNTKIKNGIKKFFRVNNKVEKEPLPFICECSEIDCDKHVKISINDYEKIHKRKDRFTILKGHKTPSVEKVINDKPEFQVVEKEQLSP